ncbi:ABC transporter ATP-binding protein [Alphaproteobacteria bacterium LSUCC0684]
MSKTHEADNAVKVEGVGKYFGPQSNVVKALDNVSVNIRRNEFFTLLGPSGCGKTTLLRLIAGFESPTFGTILLDDKDITHLPPFKRSVNTVFQNYALFPHLTVAENISFGLEMLNKPKKEIEQTVNEMLALVHMQDLRDRRTDQISGGQQQRVALARALAPKPDVLLLDEPLSALDYKLRRGMQIELKRLQLETGITFIFVTHDQEEALTMSDRIAVMNNGHILQVGSPDEIYYKPTKRFVADFIGESNFVEANINKVDKKKRQATIRFEGRKKSFTVGLPEEKMSAATTMVFIRPEHTQLKTSTHGAALTGILTDRIFFGTDTNYHLELDNGEPFIVRSQNTIHSSFNPAIGDKLGIFLEEDALKILED